jgi:hypothetical protein
VRFFRDNGLSVAFWLLFVLTMAGNIVAAMLLAREEPATHGGSGLAAAIGDPEFLKGLFGNWQAALLQLLMLILLAKFLRQRGASHSREPADEAAREALTQPQRTEPEGDGPIAQAAPWLYQHSLSLAFTALWLPSLLGFFLADRAATNQARVRAGEAALGPGEFLGSARFWFDTFQVWQAEFLAMAVFLLLTIYLREKGSPESKPVGAGNRDTGDANE